MICRHLSMILNSTHALLLRLRLFTLFSFELVENILATINVPPKTRSTCSDLRRPESFINRLSYDDRKAHDESTDPRSKKDEELKNDRTHFLSFSSKPFRSRRTRPRTLKSIRSSTLFPHPSIPRSKSMIMILRWISIPFPSRERVEAARS
jgi:hypothetical protein